MSRRAAAADPQQLALFETPAPAAAPVVEAPAPEAPFEPVSVASVNRSSPKRSRHASGVRAVTVSRSQATPARPATASVRSCACAAETFALSSVSGLPSGRRQIRTGWPSARCIAAVGKLARGYVYYVSLKGVTGAANIDLIEVAAKLPKIKSATNLPVGVGFGIRDAATAKSVAGIADAVVIGSRIIQEIENSDAANVLENVAQLLRGIRAAMDSNSA